MYESLGAENPITEINSAIRDVVAHMTVDYVAFTISRGTGYNAAYHRFIEDLERVRDEYANPVVKSGIEVLKMYIQKARLIRPDKGAVLSGLKRFFSGVEDGIAQELLCDILVSKVFKEKDLFYKDVQPYRVAREILVAAAAKPADNELTVDDIKGIKLKSVVGSVLLGKVLPPETTGH